MGSAGDAEVVRPRRDLRRQGGFNDYLAYVFRAHKVVVLESVRMDNAIYVFGLDWQGVSQLTKAQVLSNKYHQGPDHSREGLEGPAGAAADEAGGGVISVRNLNEDDKQ